MLLIGSAAAAAACSAPEDSHADGVPGSIGGDASPDAATVAGAEAAEAPAPATRSRRGGRRIDSDELVGLGELGLLPSLIQTLGTGVDCDFDDALSTCQ